MVLSDALPDNLSITIIRESTMEISVMMARQAKRYLGVRVSVSIKNRTIKVSTLARSHTFCMDAEP